MDEAPVLEVRRDGTLQARHPVSADRVSIGRRSSTWTPDIVLADEGAWVSRRQCEIWHQQGGWWIADTHSRNGTFLRRDSRLRRITQPLRLRPGDVVCITATADDHGPTSSWELVLVDPVATRSVEVSLTGAQSEPGAVAASDDDLQDGPVLRWDPDRHLAWVVSAAGEEAVELRPQGEALVAHMAARNLAAGADEVVCSVDELLEAVWGPPDDWDHYHPPTADNVRDVVLQVRTAIEPDRSAPVLLTNKRGVGYRLRTGLR